MKNLRHLLRRSGLQNAAKRRRKSKDAVGGLTARRLGSESLEKRQLLAGDLASTGMDVPADTPPREIAYGHNYWHAADVDDNQQITAGDALRVINLLNRQGGTFEINGPGQVDSFADVNADGKVTAADALAVINTLNRGESAGELVELFLNATQENETSGGEDVLTSDSIREINVDVGEIFYLELSYSDLRGFGSDIGAFQISTDINFSQPGLVTPLLTETQFLVIEENIRQSTSGDLTFSIQGSSATYVSNIGAFGGDPQEEIQNALIAFGYTADQFEVNRLADNFVLFDGQPTSPEPDPGNISYEIRYTDFDLANQDLPDITVTANLSNTVRTFTDSTPPVDGSGNQNGDAAGDNLDTRSRSAPGADPFGREIYGLRKFGTFDPATGFDELGALGPANPDGIEGAVGDFPEPFDAFSIPIFINAPVTGLRISLEPADNDEAILLYGRDDGGIPQDMVLINQLLGSITINATGQAVGVSAGDASLQLTEDTTTAATIDLASLVTVNSGDTPTFTITTDGTRGNASVNGSTLSYLPDADEFGSDTIVYTATNSAGSDTGTITLDIAGVNDPPIAGADTATTDAGEPVTINVLTNDSAGPANENQTLTITAVGAASGGIAAISGNSIVYTPNAGFTGTDNFTYTISDGTETTQGTVDVTVNAVSVGVVAGDGTLSTTEDAATAVTIDLSTLVTINSGGAATFSITTNGSRGTGTLVGSILSYVPSEDEFGTDAIVYQASNSAGSDTGTISIAIAAENDPPIANPDSGSGDEDSMITIDVLANDTAGAGESDTLTIQSVADGTSGTTSISNGEVQYTPNPNFFGSDTFTYVVSDGALTATGTVSVTVVAVNDPPVAGTDSATVNEDSSVNIDVLSNDSAGPANENQTLSVALDLSAAPAHGSVILESDNTITYTPAADYFGTDSFGYFLSDGVDTVSGTVNVVVNPVNDPPVAVNDSAATQENIAVTINVLSNDSVGAANESDVLTVQSATQGANGSTSVGSDGSVTYTPATGFFGTDTFQYTVSDGTATATATVTVTVSDTLSPPTASNGSLSTVEDQATPVTIDLATLVSVDAGDSFSVAITANPTRGTATLNGTILSYLPSADEFGSDSLVYTATNSVGSDTGTINIQIAAVNDPPVLGVTNATALKDGEVDVDVLAGASSGAANENDTLSLVDVTDPPNGTTTVDGGIITYTPDTGFVGTDSFQYTVSDGSASVTQTVTVTVDDFSPSVIGGFVFFDSIENIDTYSRDPLHVTPVRNGEYDSDEYGLGGAAVQLVSAATQNVTGQAVERTVHTNLDGGYSFGSVAPGTYELRYGIDPMVIFGQNVIGSTAATSVSDGVIQVVIGAAGGEIKDLLDFSLHGMRSNGLGDLDMLVSNHLRNSPTTNALSGGGSEGGVVGLSGNGGQRFFRAKDGFDDIRFAELVLNDSRDAALLTVIRDDGSVETARLEEHSFVVNAAGTAVQFFGGMEDFDFAPAGSDLVATEFDQYRNAIDQVLSELGSV